MENGKWKMENKIGEEGAPFRARPDAPFLDVLLLSFEIWVFIFVSYCALTFADLGGLRCHGIVKSGISREGREGSDDAKDLNWKMENWKNEQGTLLL
jgi:hypothetical protein